MKLNFSFAIKAGIALSLLQLLAAPQPAHARPPIGKAIMGTVKAVDHKTCEITLAEENGSLRKFVYAKRAKLWRESVGASPAELKAGMRVKVKLRHPLIGPDYVTTIEQIPASAK